MLPGTPGQVRFAQGDGSPQAPVGSVSGDALMPLGTRQHRNSAVNGISVDTNHAFVLDRQIPCAIVARMIGSKGAGGHRRSSRLVIAARRDGLPQQ